MHKGFSPLFTFGGKFPGHSDPPKPQSTPRSKKKGCAKCGAEMLTTSEGVYCSNNCNNEIIT